MTSEELLDRYRTFAHEAVRIEALQHYVVRGDEERQRAFREGRPLPSRPDKQASVQIISDAVRAGKAISRVHVIERPLSDYVRYELEAYAENEAAGERVWIAERGPDLDLVRRDFVLFDPGTPTASVIWYDYTADGELLGYAEGGPADVDKAARQLALVRMYASPLADFMSSL